MAVTVPMPCSSSCRSASNRLRSDQRTAVTALLDFAAAREKWCRNRFGGNGTARCFGVLAHALGTCEFQADRRRQATSAPGKRHLRA